MAVASLPDSPAPNILCISVRFAGLGQAGPGRTEKPKPRIWGNSTQKPKLKKNNFGGDYDTYTKMIRKRRNGFLNRSQNAL